MARRTRKVEVIPAQEAEIVENMASGMSPAQAVQAAGVNLPQQPAEVYGKTVWRRNVDGNSCMVGALAEVGVTPTVLAQKLADKLEAKSIIPMGKSGVMEVDDHSIQLKAADMIMKTVGGYAATKTEHTEMKFEEILIHLEGLD